MSSQHHFPTIALNLQYFVHYLVYHVFFAGLIHPTMVEFISHLAKYIHTLCVEVIGQTGAFTLRAMICLQAQSLELHQLKMQFTDSLAKMQSLSYDCDLLHDASGEKDRTIAKLEK